MNLIIQATTSLTITARIYVGNEGSNNLHVIDTGTNALLATVPVGIKPIRVVMSRN